MLIGTIERNIETENKNPVYISLKTKGYLCASTRYTVKFCANDTFKNPSCKALSNREVFQDSMSKCRLVIETLENIPLRCSLIPCFLEWKRTILLNNLILIWIRSTENCIVILMGEGCLKYGQFIDWNMWNCSCFLGSLLLLHQEW